VTKPRLAPAPGVSGLATPARPLAGKRIVVTRPQAQAAALCEMIRAAGGIPVCFPTIAIEPLADHAALDAALARLAEFDLAVFVSANAVAAALARLRGAWPAQVAAGATGPGTAQALERCGVARVILPARQFDSEGLLQELDARGISPKSVMIIKGEGGRDWLADTLRARGAAVTALPAYRRVRAQAEPSIIGDPARAGTLGGVVVSSSEGGVHLLAMLGEAALDWLNRAPVFVPHERIAAHLRARGLTQVVLTDGGDAGLIAGMSAHFAVVPA
jgi:uroporphyrinogen-III synthase